MATSRRLPIMERISNLGKAMESKKEEDLLSKCEPCYVQLYTYEWTINNYSMMKSSTEPTESIIFRVGPYENMIMKLLLWRNGDNLKIEVQLLKDVKLSEEMKLKEANCPLTLKISKNILHLEFLDSTGKPIDYYMSLPYEFKYINTSSVYAWVKEENVSRFINNDALTIRAKLSIRYYDSLAEVGGSSDGKSSKVLMNDMKNLFNDRSRFPDLVIKVGGQFVLAHKSIVYTQCPYFAEMAKSDAKTKEQEISALNLPTNISNILKEDCETLSISNENADVFLSVLHFIYCTKMHVTDSVNDFAVYEFARKYGVRELSMLMMPSEIKVRSEVKIEKLSYTWYVKNFTALCKTGFAPIQSPNFRTEVQADISWSVVIFCLDSQNIILNLQRNSGFNSDVQTSFKLAVCRADGAVHDEREFQHLFSSGTITNCHPGFMNSVSRFRITPDLLYNDTLTVCCDLTVSTGAMVSELKHAYPGEYRNVDFTYWTGNFRDLFDKQNFCDATLLVDDKEFKIHKALLSARSAVFARMFESDMEEKRSGCVKIEDICSDVMRQALLYIYTGELADLTMEHAPELYRTADKYELMDLKTRCSEFIMKNMDPESASEILILADLYSDEKMKKAAKHVICRNAAQALLSPSGMELITNHPLLAHDILESLSVVFCSLPPQDKYERFLFLSNITAAAAKGVGEPRTPGVIGEPKQFAQAKRTLPAYGAARAEARTPNRNNDASSSSNLISSFKSVSLNSNYKS